MTLRGADATPTEPREAALTFGLANHISQNISDRDATSKTFIIMTINEFYNRRFCKMLSGSIPLI